MGKIGRTSDGGVIYAINGQANHDWVEVVPPGWMVINQLYRKEKLGPVSVKGLKVNEVLLVAPPDWNHILTSSDDKELIADIVNAYESPRGVPYANIYGAIYHIDLNSPALSGLSYEIDVNEMDVVVSGDDKKVYLEDDRHLLVPANDMVSMWVGKAL